MPKEQRIKYKRKKKKKVKWKEKELKTDLILKSITDEKMSSDKKVYLQAHL